LQNPTQKIGNDLKKINELERNSKNENITDLCRGKNEFKKGVKVKVKLSLFLTKHHAMKTYWGSGGIVPRILDLGTRWREWSASRPLYPPAKSLRCPLDRRLGGPQSRSGRGGEEKNSLRP
jgi:hypothetical protein